MKKIQARNRRKENGKKPKQIIMPQEEESMNYFSTYEDEIIGVELEDEEISEKPRIKEYIADLF